MRQVGIVAAPALYALENVDRLAVDHENAARLAEGLDAIDGLSASEPETNIVLVDTAAAELTAEAFLDRCADVEVAGNAFGEYTVRFCTHLDVSAEDVEAAVDRVEPILER